MLLFKIDVFFLMLFYKAFVLMRISKHNQKMVKHS